MACLDADTFTALFAGGLSDAERDAVEAHVDTCAACRQAIAALARTRHVDPDRVPTTDRAPGRTGPTAGAHGTGTGSTLAQVRLEPGDEVGRYVVTGFLGAGAMGAVYGARDPQLDRPVALKIVAADAGGARARRLVREAQAMARLSHPNVIPVYDAGESGGLVFIAMKQVDGVSLRAHLGAGSRAPGEVLRLLREAGAGVAAAHATGIVHRDLKPDNILVEKHGAAQVGDFGLAAMGGEDDGDAETAAAGDSAERSWRTADGTILGTPAYMAPEVKRGEPADERSDQYSFGVTLAEAITGAAPSAAVSAPMPRRVRAVVARATAVAPGDRFGSMGALLAALQPRGSARTAAVVVGAIAIATVVIVAWPRPAAQADAAAACERAANERLAGAWSPAVRRDVEAHVAGLAGPGAAMIATAAVERVDRHASAWLAMRREACVASRVRGEQTPALLDLRMACLDERLDELAVVRRSLAELDAAHLDGASRLADLLGDLAPCADAATLLRRAPADDPGGKTRALRGELAAIKALVTLAAFDEAQQRSSAAIADASASRLPVVEAEARLVNAMVLGRARRPGAADGFHAALSIGERIGDAAIRADALNGLVAGAVGDPARTSEVELLEKMAEDALAQLPGEQRLRRAMLAANLANHHVSRGELARAQEAAERSIELFTAELGATHSYTIMARQNLARLLSHQRRYDDAIAEHAAILAATRAAFGEEHPLVARELLAQGVTFAQADRRPEARASIEAGVALTEKVLGTDHIEVAGALRTLGFYLIDEDAAGARDAFARAIEIFKRTSAQHLDLAPLRVGLGEAELALGHTVDGVRELEVAIASWGDSKLNMHLLPTARFALAQGLWTLGRERARARKLALQARDEFVANAGPWQARAEEVTAWLRTHR